MYSSRVMYLALVALMCALVSAQAQTLSCGGQNYDSTKYVCVSNMLCPTSAPKLCGKDCYSDASYWCDNGVIRQNGAVSTSSSTTQPTNQYPTQQYPTNQYPTQQYPTQQYPTQQYPTNQYPTQQYPTQQYPTQQYPTQQYPTQQYPTNQYPTQQYPQTQYPTQTSYPGNQYGYNYGFNYQGSKYNVNSNSAALQYRAPWDWEEDQFLQRWGSGKKFQIHEFILATQGKDWYGWWYQPTVPYIGYGSWVQSHYGWGNSGSNYNVLNMLGSAPYGAPVPPSYPPQGVYGGQYSIL